MLILADYDDYDRPPVWMSGPGSHNGDMRGSRSPYEMNSGWGSPNERGRMGGMHCVHMRGLPFRASQLDILEVSV